MKNRILAFILLVGIIPLQAQKVKGEVITEFGETFPVLNPDFKTDTSTTFKVVFDISRAPQDSTQISPFFNTAARFLNMHQGAGVPLEQLKPVLVVHGNAAYGLLNNAAYQEMYGVDNPNLSLLDALHKAGAQIIICGQTAQARDISKEKRWPQTRLALSAMTALIQLQNDGYRLISF